MRKSLPAAPVASMQQLEGRTLLAGTGLAGAYFARTNLTLARFAEFDPTVDFAWSGGTPAASLGTDGFSVRWSGQILAKYSEAHTFIVTSSGGVRLWVNGGLIIDDWTSHPLQEDTGVVRLTAGKRFDIRMEYWSDGSDPQVTLEWQSDRMDRGVIPSNRLFPYSIDDVPPTTPAHLRAVSNADDSIDLTWDPSHDPSGVVDYDVYVGSTKVAALTASQTSYTRAHLNPSTSYTFSVLAMDAAGNTSDLATTAVTTAAPFLPGPTVPAGLQITDVSDSSVSLQWSASTDSGNVTGYRVYRNGVKLGAAPTGTSFTDTGLSSSTQYTYAVRAADDSGLFSGFSQAATATTNDGAATHDALAGINAVDFDDSSGISTGNNEINGLDNGDWVLYRNTQFGSGAQSVKLNLALDPNNRGGTIEFHLNSPNGTLIGSHLVQPTGSSSTFITQQLDISTTSGVHDLYLVFTGRSDIAHLQSMTFSTTHLIRIMPLGDSITQAFVGTPSYRYYLWQLLQNAGDPVDFVGSQTSAQNGTPPNLNFDQNHEGHSGWTADQIAANAAAWAAEFQPDIVLMHAGSNDAEEHQSTDSTMSDLANIVSAIRSVDPNVTILMAQLIPDAGNQDGIDAINARIPGLAASLDTQQSRVIVVDMATDFSSSDTFDGVHLTSAGESKFAQHWFNALQPLLQ